MNTIFTYFILHTIMIRFEYELEQFVAKSCNDIVNSMTKPAFSHRLQAVHTTMLGLYICLLLSRRASVDACVQCMRPIFFRFHWQSICKHNI